MVPGSTISDATVQGPWDSALFDQGGTAKLFVANALSGAIVRYDLNVTDSEVNAQLPLDFRPSLRLPA
jgi:hypothetical protein